MSTGRQRSDTPPLQYRERSDRMVLSIIKSSGLSGAKLRVPSGRCARGTVIHTRYSASQPTVCEPGAVCKANRKLLAFPYAPSNFY